MMLKKQHKTGLIDKEDQMDEHYMNGRGNKCSFIFCYCCHSFIAQFEAVSSRLNSTYATSTSNIDAINNIQTSVSRY